MQPDSCDCGRRRFTHEDLERWKREFPDGHPHPDPPWAAEICWFNGSGPCGRKPVDQAASA